MHAIETIMTAATIPQEVLIRGTLVDEFLQILFSCRADVLQQVMLGQHQQLSIHVSNDAGSSDPFLQCCRLSKGLELAVCHDLQPHFLRACIEECVGCGVCCSLQRWQLAAGWSDGCRPAHWHLFKGRLLITAGTLHCEYHHQQASVNSSACNAHCNKLCQT